MASDANQPPRAPAALVARAATARARDRPWQPLWPLTWFSDPGLCDDPTRLRAWLQRFLFRKWVPLGEGSWLLTRFAVSEVPCHGGVTEVSSRSLAQEGCVSSKSLGH